MRDRLYSAGPRPCWARRPFPAAACLLLLGGCAYLERRAADLGDVVTLTGEKDALGAKGMVGPWGFGVYFAREGYEMPGGYAMHPRGRGLIGGQWTDYAFEDGFWPPWVPWKHRQSFHDFATDGRAKEFCTESVFPFPVIRAGDADTTTRRLAPRYTAIEATIAVGIGVRAGFNPGELLDFLLGFAGVDLYGDDLHAAPLRPVIADSADSVDSVDATTPSH